MRSVCVFCGAGAPRDTVYFEAARRMGAALAERNLELVYGGANLGLMRAVANAALEGGGQVFGVIPEALVEKEIAHRGLTELHVVPSMHARKAMMAARADAFIALPGGFGTIEELFEMLTWRQLALHRKPCALLNVEHYFDGLLSFLDHAVKEEFLKASDRAILLVDTSPEHLVKRLIAQHEVA
jgi:uncharacterized protein (TIGR00730 family)